MSSADRRGTASPLLGVLRARIERDGPVPVDEFMRVCLADPEHGYWQRPGVIGAAGDFITAPEISQTFGELIGLWCGVVWQGMGQPAPLRLVELGPGRGTLMRDALRAARVVPRFLKAITVHLIEISAPLREVQRQSLGLAPPLLGASPPRRAEGASSTRRGEGGTTTADVPGFPPPLPSPTSGEGVAAPTTTWHETMDQAPPGPAIIVANEFLDALPIRQLVFLDGVWHERVVDLDAEGALRLATGPAVQYAGDALAGPPQEGDILELRPGENVLLAELAHREAPFHALFVDYGPAKPAYSDTLQAVRRHTWVDPLAEPGLADLTAHVQFAHLASKARAAGLAVDGPMPQAEFLGRLGMAERAARLMAINPGQAAAIEAGVQRLLSPTGMGTLFKMLAVRSRSLPPAAPFV
jgi:NADH dehydrogenase [ubiquinone] 1 alpha subcomplex assembly factor 7